jgi:hypothetical protein
LKKSVSAVVSFSIRGGNEDAGGMPRFLGLLLLDEITSLGKREKILSVAQSSCAMSLSASRLPL